MVKGKGLLFGLNYQHCSSGKLNGCINDVLNISEFLNSTYGFQVDIYTDDVNLHETSGMGIMRKLYELALETYRDDLEFVWIHYSGHGSYIKDESNDEQDGNDECLVPSDYQTTGLIPDDFICSLFTYFNPKTRVVFVFDCCHSGTIGDVKYSWEGFEQVSIENMQCSIPAKIITLSGCLDNQTSADAFNVLGDNKYVGALTACLLSILKDSPELKNDVFGIVSRLRLLLQEKQFSQVPKLCSTYDLYKDKVFIP
jgi:hypothetical protein